jgi:hypothetical protein
MTCTRDDDDDEKGLLLSLVATHAFRFSCSSVPLLLAVLLVE